MENSVLLDYDASKDILLWILFEKITKDGDASETPININISRLLGMLSDYRFIKRCLVCQ
jgi:hypothetical protein